MGKKTNQGRENKMKIRSGYVSNSSTSSFICETDLDPIQVKAKLIDLLEMYNDFMGEELFFDAVFEDPFIADSSYCEGGWADYYKAVKAAKGKVIIHSACDNTIPDELWEFIIRKFNATRCHFG